MDVDAYGLGRLERLSDPREVWKHEAVDFTPWLAENIEVLSDAIGLPLTVIAQEVLVGEFRLDIQAADPDGKTVIIENQLESSNHTHLGQLLVYASGLEASTAIWITTRLRDEHRSALTWVNERTDSDVRVFGIELSVVRIGESARAPVFDVVVEPNEWAKVTKETSKASASGANQLRMTFFDDVFDLVAARYPGFRTPKTQVSNWCSFASGPFGYYCLTFSKKGYRVEVYLDTQDRAGTKEVYDRLYAERERLQQDLGVGLDWERLNNNRGSRFATYLKDFDLDTADETARQRAVEWSATTAITFHQKLDDHLRALAKAVKQTG